MMAGYDVFTGCIAAGSFTSGDTVVVGAWRGSPLGQVVDVMWVRPDGQRVLLAPHEQLRSYVAGLYRFDRTEVVDVSGGWDGGAVSVQAGPLRVHLVAGPRDWRSWVFAARPRRLRRAPAWIRVEDVVGRPLVGLLIGGAAGVRAAGRAPGGQRELYGVDDWRPVAHGRLEVEGVDAGGLTDLRPDLDVGLSAFPTRPAVVHVGTLIERPASR
jgi:hypothetical protein